jgi:cystathionine beta-lyase
MMPFDFDTIIPRRHTASVKWDLQQTDGILPMWVADMDFKTAPAITEALARRVAHGIFGYTLAPDDYFEAITGWWQQRHGFAVDRNWILPATGIIPALAVIVKALTDAGDTVLIQSPVYNHFFDTIAHAGRRLVSSDLLYQDGTYCMDYADLEQKAADPAARLLLLCNPHNPVGRSWTREELERVGTICLRHGVTIVSDEIHADLVYDPFRHKPFASLNEAFRQASVTCAAPSKTFNLAGLQTGYMLVPDKTLRSRISKRLQENEVGYTGTFAVEALIAAYRQGAEWLDALKAYLYSNYVYVKDFIAAYLPFCRVLPLEATYLVWLDCSALPFTAQQLADHLLKAEKLWVNPGTLYGANGEGFLRLNIACPRVLLQEGLEKLRKGLLEMKGSKNMNGSE